MRPVMAVFLLLIAGIFLINPTFINADTDPTDAAALRVLYSSLNSPGQLTKWTSNGGDPCGESWRGVTCSGNKVTEIKLSGLGLSGNMGYQLASLTSLTTFDLSNNNLGNQIPYALPPNVQNLNLAGCGFTGGLPYSISQMTSLRSLNVARNQIQGQLNDMFGSLSSLSTMDLSFNAMTGELPESFSSLSSLHDLYVQNNQFSGTIDVLANLPLKTLNVENNRFTGWVPDQLRNINLQRGGNSWSSGPAPPGRPAAPSRPNNGNNSNNNSPSSSGGGGGKSSGIGGGAIAGILISLLVVGAIIAFFLIKRRKSKRSASSDIEKLDDQPFAPLASQPQNNVQELKSIQTPSSAKAFEAPAALNLRPPPFDRTKSFDDDDFTAKPIVTKKVNMPPIDAKLYSVADLQIATDSFNSDNLIGEGSHGRVYRAQFDDGKVLAVKKISSSALAGQVSEDFLNIVSAISRLKHPNVTELVGYCSEHGQHLLIFEFLKNGSLYDFLHLSDEFTKPLTWNNRVQIALGAARALEYLHEVCSPSVVHKNLKSANILLDSDLSPRLSDCGLSSLVPENDQASLASGYSAPEVAMSGQYTIKSDVYSFGVIMLELVSGRQPFDSSRTRLEQSLVRWATPQLHDIDALAKMVDPTLKGLYPVKSLSRLADVIALCVQPEPEFRPPMSEVVEALVRLVQRANMSKRTVGNDQGSGTLRADNADGYDYEP